MMVQLQNSLMLKFKTLSITPPNSVYVEPSTGYHVPWLTSFKDVLDKVKEHRELHGLPLTEGWEQEVESQLAMTLKVDHPEQWIEDTEKPYIPRLVAYGRAMWAELHERALAFPEHPTEFDRQAEVLWLQGWKARIPSSLCDCAYKWRKMGLDFDLSDCKGYYTSTVVVHDAIRASLGQPMMEGEFRHLSL
jgi:hypothetical protein